MTAIVFQISGEKYSIGIWKQIVSKSYPLVSCYCTVYNQPLFLVFLEPVTSLCSTERVKYLSGFLLSWRHTPDQQQLELKNAILPLHQEGVSWTGC